MLCAKSHRQIPGGDSLALMARDPLLIALLIHAKERRPVSIRDDNTRLAYVVPCGVPAGFTPRVEFLK
jgi:hypothetical protein